MDCLPETQLHACAKGLKPTNGMAGPGGNQGPGIETDPSTVFVSCWLLVGVLSGSRAAIKFWVVLPDAR